MPTAHSAPMISREDRSTGVAARGFRTISYNVLGAHGFTRPQDKPVADFRATLKSQVPARLAMELALYRPDIVTLQEAPAEEIVAKIAADLRMSYVFFPGKWAGNDDWPIGFPGAILTNGEIIESRNRPMVSPEDDTLFTRHWGRAVVRKDDREIVVFTLHAYYLTPDAEQDNQRREMIEAMKVVKLDVDAGRNILLQGDFNQPPDAPEHANWIKTGLVDSFDARGTGPGHTFPSHAPRMRLDYIWASRRLAELLRDCRLLSDPPFAMAGGDGRSYALSDHLPVMATFEWD